MIYKDKDASGDDDRCPNNRGDTVPCLNCQEVWCNHSNWRCPTALLYTGETRFSRLPSHQRYCTQEMKDSLNQNASTNPSATFPMTWHYVRPGVYHSALKSLEMVVQKTGDVHRKEETDLSDWKAWQHKAPGECACGIPKARCDYHR